MLEGASLWLLYQWSQRQKYNSQNNTRFFVSVSFKGTITVCLVNFNLKQPQMCHVCSQTGSLLWPWTERAHADSVCWRQLSGSEDKRFSRFHWEPFSPWSEALLFSWLARFPPTTKGSLAGCILCDLWPPLNHTLAWSPSGTNVHSFLPVCSEHLQSCRS